MIGRESTNLAFCAAIVDVNKEIDPVLSRVVEVVVPENLVDSEQLTVGKEREDRKEKLEREEESVLDEKPWPKDGDQKPGGT